MARERMVADSKHLPEAEEDWDLARNAGHGMQALLQYLLQLNDAVSE
jgi:hypothetical protein